MNGMSKRIPPTAASSARRLSHSSDTRSFFVYSLLILAGYVSAYAGASIRASYLVLAGGCAIVLSGAYSWLFEPNRPREIRWTASVVAVYFFISLHDLHSRLIGGDSTVALLMFAQSCIPTFILLLGPILGGWPPAKILKCLCVGFTGYALLNYASYMLGYRGVLTDIGEFYTISMSGVGERWLMRFASGINSFGVLCGIFFAIVTYQAIIHLRVATAVKSLGYVLMSGVCIFGIFVVETRAIIYMAIVPVLAVLLRTKRHSLVAVASYSCLGLVVFITPLYLMFLSSPVPERLDPVVAKFERVPGQWRSLSGRAFLWGHSMEVIKDNEVPLLGLGIGNRDVSSAYVEATGSTGLVGTTRHPHNGALEIYLVYGPLGAAALLLFAAAVMHQLLRFRRILGDDGHLMLFVFWAIITANWTESFVSHNTFWVLLIVCCYTLDWSGRAAHRDYSMNQSGSTARMTA